MPSSAAGARWIAKSGRSGAGGMRPISCASDMPQISGVASSFANGVLGDVVAEFGNLPEEEAWLLSVHFEVAKDNL